MSIHVRNPATDQVIGQIPDLGAEGTKNAIDRALHALEDWRGRAPDQRCDLLRRFGAAMLESQERLARLLTSEQGKPLSEARAEISYAASFLEWAAEEARRLKGAILSPARSNQRILTVRRPVGVVAAITPWNFPAAMITRKIAPALAVGCTVVVKPAEQTPLTALAIAELGTAAGLPAGVLNVVTGRPQPIADAIFDHQDAQGVPIVRKVSFTGSTEVGKILMQKAASGLTRLSLELGGHAPFIVFEDADLDVAVAAAIASKFRNAGQTCICANRFLVHRSVADDFTQRLVDGARTLKVGAGDEESTRIGPLIDDAAVAKVRHHIHDARSRGGHIACGGETMIIPGRPDRYFPPTIITGAHPDMACWNEETFGPVAPIMVFDTPRQAVSLANATPYGLAAYFFTRNLSMAWRIAEQLEFGVIGINDGAPSTARAPFGGVKQSGFGREGGAEGLDEYLETTYISLGLEP